MVFKPTFSKRNVWMRKNILPLPQELNYSAVSVMGTENTALQPASNTSNSAPNYGMPYYEYICTWVNDLLTVLHNATTMVRYLGSM